ncbi:lysosomal acid phosphatase-like [Hyalella azteca]|uniref:Lysosomal acid phosphatase-like n=1 Tax=Hyalella azteca TaxID=294128 RepID=A0A979FYG3_HYAAZ|nr:lysosomal acid phosphatase-like [Hyalella azteca]
MKNVSDFLFSHVYFGTNELLRLRAGRLQNTILKNMRLKSSSGGLGPSLALFSGDDETVAAQLKTLGIDALTQPPYAAALVYELHRRDNGTYFVKVFYHTDESMTSDPAFISNILCPPTGECDLEEWFSFAHTWAVPDADFPDVCVSKPERILRTVIMWFWDLLPMTCLCAVFLLTVFYRVSEFRCGKYAQMEE